MILSFNSFKTMVLWFPLQILLKIKTSKILPIKFVTFIKIMSFHQKLIKLNKLNSSSVSSTNNKITTKKICQNTLQIKVKIKSFSPPKERNGPVKKITNLKSKNSSKWKVAP